MTSPSAPSRPYRLRRRKLVKPRLQLRMVAGFAWVGGVAFALTALLLMRELIQFTTALPAEVGEQVAAALPGLVVRAFATALAVVVPLVLAAGTLLTFRIAGPVYRFERYLESVASGAETAPCRLREGDELTELCDLINAATAPTRAENERRGAQPSLALVEATV